MGFFLSEMAYTMVWRETKIFRFFRRHRDKGLQIKEAWNSCFPCYNIGKEKSRKALKIQDFLSICNSWQLWWHSQVVRQGSAKPWFPGSNPGVTSRTKPCNRNGYRVFIMLVLRRLPHLLPLTEILPHFRSRKRSYELLHAACAVLLHLVCHMAVNVESKSGCGRSEERR